MPAQRCTALAGSGASNHEHEVLLDPGTGNGRAEPAGDGHEHEVIAWQVQPADDGHTHSLSCDAI